MVINYCSLILKMPKNAQYMQEMATYSKPEQEAPLPRRTQRVRRAQLVYFMTFIARKTTEQQLINHLYETGHETYRIPRNNAK